MVPLPIVEGCADGSWIESDSSGELDGTWRICEGLCLAVKSVEAQYSKTGDWRRVKGWWQSSTSPPLLPLRCRETEGSDDRRLVAALLPTSLKGPASMQKTHRAPLSPPNLAVRCPSSSLVDVPSTVEPDAWHCCTSTSASQGPLWLNALGHRRRMQSPNSPVTQQPCLQLLMHALVGI